jgi:uncharacterized protein YbjT (DUF2867 family)
MKASAENLVRGGDLPWSIVPATPFYWLVARMLDAMVRRRVWPLPAGLDMQPADSADFAGYVVECLAEGPGGLRADFGGPEIMTLTEIARQYQEARGVARRIVAVPLPRFALRAGGRQTCPDGRRGRTTWAEWLRR